MHTVGVGRRVHSPPPSEDPQRPWTGPRLTDSTRPLLPRVRRCPRSDGTPTPAPRTWKEGVSEVPKRLGRRPVESPGPNLPCVVGTDGPPESETPLLCPSKPATSTEVISKSFIVRIQSRPGKRFVCHLRFGGGLVETSVAQREGGTTLLRPETPALRDQLRPGRRTGRGPLPSGPTGCRETSVQEPVGGSPRKSGRLVPTPLVDPPPPPGLASTRPSRLKVDRRSDPKGLGPTRSYTPQWDGGKREAHLTPLTRRVRTETSRDPCPPTLTRSVPAEKTAVTVSSAT